MADERRFGLSTATALVVASMVGSGVFTTSGLLLEILPDPAWVLLAWLAGGLLAGCGALSYGALARRFPESGGEYLYLSRTLHPVAGAMAGWVSLLAGFSAPLAGSALAFGEYLAPWLPASTPSLTGSLLLSGLAWLHGYRVEGASRLQNLAVIFNLCLMGAFIAMARPLLPAPDASYPGFQGHPAPGAFLMALVWVSFSYSGWNAAVYIAGEVRDPARNLPRALILGTVLVGAIYLLLNDTILRSAPPGYLAGKVDVAREAAFALGGRVWADAVTWLVALALCLSLSALMMAGPRVYSRMARDGCLPGWFAAFEDGAPRRAVLLQYGLALLLLWSLSFRELLTYIGFTLGLGTTASLCGLMRLRTREGPALRVPGWPWLPAIHLVAMVVITASAMINQPRESLWGLMTLLAGALIWRRARTPPAPLPPG